MNLCQLEVVENDISMFACKGLEFSQFGKPRDVLEFKADAQILQALGPGEVLVRILAAPINPADLNFIEGTYGVKPSLPATPGIEGFGVVVASNSVDFKVEDRVIFLRRAATWASYAIVSADVLYRLPAGIDPLQAAMLKVNPATAWQLLHGFGTLERGDWIVQNAGNSAVGRCVIQIARDLGIRTISFVRRSEVIDDLRELGADQIFNDDESGFASAIDVLGGANAALAFNAVGGESALRLMKLLRESGTHITYGAMSRKPLTIPNGLMIFRDLQLRGLWVSRWLESAPHDEVIKVYDNLVSHVITGKLVQPVDSTHVLENYHHAFDRLEAQDRAGKVLFVP